MVYLPYTGARHPRPSRRDRHPSLPGGRPAVAADDELTDTGSWCSPVTP
ncbi:hypothetical protein ATKI12_0010 [Kitasatospora sp. Ki12]